MSDPISQQQEGFGGDRLGAFAVAEKGQPFVANPAWKRRLWRWWRLAVLARRGSAMKFIVPPREWSQESADAAIARGRELAEKYGW